MELDWAAVQSAAGAGAESRPAGLLSHWRPRTTRKGESFFAFLNHALVCGWVSAWWIEAARLRRRSVPALSVGNRMLLYVLIQAVLLAAIGVLAGLLAAAFFIVQSFIAVHLLEAANYVQHYGLQRRSGVGGATLRVGEDAQRYT